MERSRQIVISTVVGLSVATVVSVIIYTLLPSNLQNILIFALIVISAWTSFGGIYWSLYTVYNFYREIERTKREMEARLGSNMVRRLGELAVKVYKHLSDLTPEQREKLIGLIESGIEFAFLNLKRLTKKPPRVVIETYPVGKTLKRRGKRGIGRYGSKKKD